MNGDGQQVKNVERQLSTYLFTVMRFRDSRLGNNLARVHVARRQIGQFMNACKTALQFIERKGGGEGTKRKIFTADIIVIIIIMIIIHFYYDYDGWRRFGCSLLGK